MIEDMRMRKLEPKTREWLYPRCAALHRICGRSPDQASAEELRLYQLHW